MEILRIRMAASSKILEPRFVERFLVEESNSYEDLVEEIKKQFPGVKGCSLRSVKRFCSQYGIKKQYPTRCSIVSCKEQFQRYSQRIYEAYYIAQRQGLLANV